LGLVEVGSCVFISNYKSSSHKDYIQYIEQYGEFDAQGIVNHDHMGDYGIKNTLGQYAMAIYIVEYILKKSMHSMNPRKLVVYLNNQDNVTFCFYSVDDFNSPNLIALDERLRIPNIIITTREL